MKQLFQFKAFSLEYEIFGSGTDPLLALHGFGRTLDDFKLMEKSLGSRYKIVAVNLFLHGNSAYPANRIQKNPISKQELAELFEALLDELTIKQFAIAGYSMGGKIALCLLEQLQTRITRVFLFAPDGLFLNPWYKLASHTKGGRLVYRFGIRNARTIRGLARGLHRVGMLSPNTLRLVEKNLTTPERRQQVYEVWLLMRALLPEVPKIRELVASGEANMLLFFGAYDRLIPPHIGERFVADCGKPELLHVLETGHHLITTPMDLVIAERLSTLQLPPHSE